MAWSVESVHVAYRSRQQIRIRAFDDVPRSTEALTGLKTRTYSHRNADAVVGNAVTESVLRALDRVSIPIERHSTAKVRADIIRSLRGEGWSGEVPIAPRSPNKLTAMRAQVGLCVQTGNTAAIYRDLFKLMYSFQTGGVSAGVYILPTQSTAEVFGSNYATMEHLVSELESYSPIITIPLLVVGFRS